jgi:hypothetical protein
MLELKCSNRLKLTNYESKQFEDIKELINAQYGCTDLEEVILFKTKWIAPIKFIKTLSKQYPLITFSLTGETSDFVTVITLINQYFLHVEEFKHNEKPTEN